MADSRSEYIPIHATDMTGGISSEALDEFIAIYKEEFGEEISRA
jgi:hypothetical protein